jgi:hypothetical protein
MRTTGSIDQRRRRTAFLGARAPYLADRGETPLADGLPNPLSIATRFTIRSTDPEGTLKNLVIVMVLGSFLALAPASTATATCGFGNKIWAGNDGIGAKILAFTTNVWTMKGISTTSEISGCGEENNLFKKVSSAELRYYASQNLDHLAADIARGQGEHLDAVAHLIQIRVEDRDDFRALTQHHFEVLFPHDDVTAGEMLEHLSQLMTDNNALASYVEG